MAAAAADCLFCKIVAGKIPCHKILRTEHALAFFDIFPLSKGHALVIPTKHAEKMHELDAETLADIGKQLGKVAKAVVKATGCPDYNILQNNGKPAHQEVMHVHFHVIPKYEKTGAGLGIKWNSAKADDNELKALLAEVQKLVEADH